LLRPQALSSSASALAANAVASWRVKVAWNATLSSMSAIFTSVQLMGRDGNGGAMRGLTNLSIVMARFKRPSSTPQQGRDGETVPGFKRRNYWITRFRG
jgi:hypothetical protein